MQLTALVCTQCGGGLELKAGAMVSCPKCGTRYAWQNTSAHIYGDRGRQTLPGDARVNALCIYVIEAVLLEAGLSYQIALSGDRSNGTVSVYVNVLDKWELVAHIMCGSFYRFTLHDGSETSGHGLSWQEGLNNEVRMYRIRKLFSYTSDEQSLLGEQELFAKFLVPFSRDMVGIARKSIRLMNEIMQKLDAENAREKRRQEAPWYMRWFV